MPHREPPKLPAEVPIHRLTLGELPPWGAARAAALHQVLLDRTSPFPCTFAVAAARRETLRFGFVDDVHAPSTWGALHRILREYLGLYRSLARDTSLVVFFGGRMTGLGEQDFHRRFWEILQFLHDTDTAPWPADLPRDGDDPMWEFSYAGEPIFVVCNTPAHRKRPSRHSPEFMITFQPRWVFEGLEPDTARGIGARRTIRQRLRAFDGTEPSAVLGSYGAQDNREWLQYFVHDEEPSEAALAEMACPFRPHRDRAQPAVRTAPGRRWRVVINNGGHHSVWPLRRPLPSGWTDSGVTGDRKLCLSHIGEVWKDLGPAYSAGGPR